MLDKELPYQDFKKIEQEISGFINELNEQKINLLNTNKNLQSYLKLGLSVIQNLPEFYDQSFAIEIKRRILCSIFPKKLIYDGSNYRTPMMTEFLNVVLKLNAELEGFKKKGCLILQPCLGWLPL